MGKSLPLISISGSRFCSASSLPLAAEIADPQISVSGEVDLVEVHARTGAAPDWCRLPPKACAIIERNGKPKGKRYGQRSPQRGRLLPLRWVDVADRAREWNTPFEWGARSAKEISTELIIRLRRFGRAAGALTRPH